MIKKLKAIEKKKLPVKAILKVIKKLDHKLLKKMKASPITKKAAKKIIAKKLPKVNMKIKKLKAERAALMKQLAIINDIKAKWLKC